MNNALTVVEFGVPAMISNEVIAEEMDGLSVSFDRVKIPSGGGLAFEVPGDDPESPDMVKELEGVIVDHHPVNAFWRNKYDGSINNPDCSSMDGKQGFEAETGEYHDCKNCPFNQFGSGDDGKGKACKNMHRVYILVKGEMFPYLVTLPPTGLKPLSNYILKRVLSKGKRPFEVVTKITLKKAQSSGGISYSQPQFSKVASLDEESAAKMAEFSKATKLTTREYAAEIDDVVTESKDGFPE